MTMKSMWKLGAVTAVAALALTACSTGGTGTGTSATLEFQTGLAATDPILKTLTTLTTAYEADHEGVKIDLVPETNTYEADIKVRLASNDLPDIWATHGWSLLRYSEFLEPLNTQPWAKSFNPALDAAMKNSKGQFFALPADTDVAGIVYNKTVLKAAGVDPASLTTWDSFDTAAKKIKDSGVTPITASGKDSWFAGNIADFLASGSYSQDQLDGLSNGTFEPTGYTTMLDKVKTWSDDKYFNADYSSATQDDIARSLAQGDTGFVFVQNYLVASALALNPDAQLGYIPIPGFTGEPYLVGGEGHAYGVAKTSKNKDDALDYLAYLAQPANLSKLASVIGGVPGLTDATSDLGSLADSYKEFVEPGKYRLEPYFDRVYLPNGMWDTMVSTTDSIITGQANVSSAVKQVGTQYTTLSAAN